MNKYLSFDIGGTNIKYALFDHSGKMIEFDKLDTPRTLKSFKLAVNKVIDRYRNTIKGVTFSLPGRIDQDTNIIYGGGYLEYNHGLAIDQILNLSGLDFAIENDAKVSVLAESWLGELKDYTNAASIVLGTGIGGGLLISGNLYRGTNYAASEISIFIPGYIEDFSEVAAISGSAVNMVNEVNKLHNELNINDGIKAFEYINSGDKESVKIFNDFCKTIAYLIFNMQVNLDLEKFVIGGGISNQKIVSETIKKYTYELFELHPIIGNTIFKPEIESSHFKSESNLYGALYNFMLKYETDKNLQNKESK